MIVLQRILKYLLGCVTDPITGTLSSSRLAGLACVCVAGIVSLKFPKEGAATVSALIVGGAVAFLTRTKSDAA